MQVNRLSIWHGINADDAKYCQPSVERTLNRPVVEQGVIVCRICVQDEHLIQSGNRLKEIIICFSVNIGHWKAERDTLDLVS